MTLSPVRNNKNVSIWQVGSQKNKSTMEIVILQRIRSQIVFISSSTKWNWLKALYALILNPFVKMYDNFSFHAKKLLKQWID